ncbi:hypothetical protein PS15p_212036 [Mucor circinelloides]
MNKYLNRHQQLEALTMPEYFTYCIITQEMNTEDDFNNEGPPEMIGDYDYYSCNKPECTDNDNRIGMELPLICTVKFRRRYKKRSLHRKLPFWRTHLYNQQDQQESFYYQSALLYIPCKGQTALNQCFNDNEQCWKNVFFALCDQRQEIDENDDDQDQDQQERLFICRMLEAFKNKIKVMNKSLMRDALHQPLNPPLLSKSLLTC